MQDMVWTIGHSDRTVAEFITAVSAIAAGAYVVDVRSCPYSRYVPQFNREPLRAALCAAGLHCRCFSKAWRAYKRGCP